MATPAIGAQGELLVEPGASATGPGGYTFDASSERYEILRENIQAITGTVERDGFRGVRSLPKQHVKLGARAVGGPIFLNPSPADLDNWLPRIMRAAAVGDTFSLGDLNDATVKFGVMLDRVTDVFVYDNMQVSRATFRGSPGQLVEMQLDLVGFDEDTNNVQGGITFPSPAPNWGQTLAYEPYIFHEGALALTAVAAANDPFDFELVIDNLIQPRFVMSQVATEQSPSDRIITLTLSFPYDSDHVNMYRQSENVTPSGGTLTFTNGADSGLSTVFTFVHLQGGDASPILNSKGELRFAVPLRARASGTMTSGVLDQDELTITNDATPTP